MANRDKILLCFVRKVREARLSCGITQEELADRAGFGRTDISLVERGKRNLSLLNVSQLAQALLTAIEQIVLWLIRQEEYPNKRRLDNKAVEWAVAAKELRFPKQTDGKRMVKEWRAAHRSCLPR